DALGWCVALKTAEGGAYLSPNALAELSGATDWEQVQVAMRAADERRVVGKDVLVWAARSATDASMIGAPAATALTRREAEVLGWLQEGKTGPEIAVILACGRRTVESHVAQLYRKLGVRNRAQVVLRPGTGLAAGG
ncbi:MAG TPA: helix-turn-helix transcriptional regulator, partial [Rariglobus sp.]